MSRSEASKMLAPVVARPFLVAVTGKAVYRVIGILIAFAAATTAVGAAPDAALAASSPTTTVSTKPVVTFGIQPASDQAPDSRSYFDFNATEGGLIRDHVAVINYSLQTITLQIHPTDAANTAEGNFALLPPNSPDPLLGSWLTMPAFDANVTLPPRGTAIIPYSIKVPANAIPGDHIGGILATLQSSINSKSGQKIKLLQSVGTRIFVRVSGPIHPGFKISDLKINYHGTADPIGDGEAVLSYRVSNTGNVALGGNQTVSVTGLFGGRTYARNLTPIGLLLPGSVLGVRVVLPKFFPEIQMTAHVSISPLVIPGSVEPPSGPFKQDITFWAIPWTLIAIVAGVLLVLAALIFYRRRRRRHPAGGPEGSGSGPDSGVINEPASNQTGGAALHPVMAELDPDSRLPVPSRRVDMEPSSG